VGYGRSGVGVRFDGRPLTRSRELHRDDVLSVGDAQLVIAEDARTRLRLDVLHLVGNDTIAPVVTVTAIDFDTADEDVEIRTTPSAAGSRPAAAVLTAERRGRATRASRCRKSGSPHRCRVVLLLGATTLISLLKPLEIDVQPRDTRVTTPGTVLAFKSGEFLNVLTGKHVVRGEHEGYYPAQITVDVQDSATPAAAPVARCALRSCLENCASIRTVSRRQSASMVCRRARRPAISKRLRARTRSPCARRATSTS